MVGEWLVHRKGATRAFGPGSPELPACYRDISQPVICGGSMETGSYLLVGTDRAMRHLRLHHARAAAPCRAHRPNARSAANSCSGT